MTSFQRAKQFKLNQPLTRKIDLESLVHAGIDAVNMDSMLYFIHDKARANPIQIKAIFSLEYPDPGLCSCIDDETFRDDIMLFREHVLNSWLAMQKMLSLLFVQMLPDEYYVGLSSWATSSDEKMDGSAVERLVLEIPLLDGQAPTIMKGILLKTINFKTFQFARAARLKIEYSGETVQDKGTSTISGFAFSQEAPVVPVQACLQASHQQEIEAFFSHPNVAEIIAKACRGFKVTCDELKMDAAPSKRCNIDALRFQVNDPADVVGLATEYHFCAFYPAIKFDGNLGRLVLDLDVQPGLIEAIGKEAAWALVCGVSDAIIEVASSMGFPVAARHLSGSKGIHIIWEITDDALIMHDGMIDLPPYLLAIRNADNRLGAIKSTARWISEPAFIARKILEAIVIRAIYTVLSRDCLLTREQRGRLGISSDSQVVAISHDDPDAFTKIVIDAMPTCYRWFSPHYKTGWIARSIVDANGDIIPRYRNLDAIAKEFTMEATMKALDANDQDLEDHPGVITRDLLIYATTILGGELRAIIMASEKNAAMLPDDKYQRFLEEHAAILSRIQGNDKGQ